ncbi:hypothetical protein DCC81_03755 [Chitinophaga parva]|uniref:Uncharacterized protein n=2 Tax=Chitinophaga parva TaxID=2169414 RepID=A0A2T7BLT5_9BACT|nr:hypothetical protein DCC81_03755 [Chitinophaga parva]
MKQDVSESLNTDLLGDYSMIRQADSLGRAYYQKIKPSPILDLQQKKLVIDQALEFYTSKSLDSIARVQFSTFQKNMKNAY